MSESNMNRVAKSLEEASTKLFKCSFDNVMKSATDWCHLQVSTHNTVNIGAENFDIKNSHCEKHLGVKFGYKLTFTSHILDLCKKAS